MNTGLRAVCTCGLLTSELSTAESLEYLGDAAEKQVSDKTDACIAAIVTTSSDSAQATTRANCKTVTALAALAQINGVQASNISFEELESDVLAAASTQMQSTMSACMKSISTTLISVSFVKYVFRLILR